MKDETGGMDGKLAVGAAVRRCPICGKPAHADTRPFCSRRCADVDLSRWLGGGYRIPVGVPDEEDSDRRGGPDSGPGESGN